MKKENIYKFLYIVAALLVVGFAIAFGVDKEESTEKFRQVEKSTEVGFASK